ncbi:MAG: hypothetical protein CMP01_02225 [Woeseiaceae bacterium]|nr:hypothetical protein [Woeseiaceae bacterium]
MVGQTERGGSNPAADGLDRRGDDPKAIPHDLDAQTKTNLAGLHGVHAEPEPLGRTTVYQGKQRPP